MASDIPATVFDREINQITLREIFEKDEEGNYINFDATVDRRHCNLKYRIALHQRYNTWNKEAKNTIIDSIYRNYIIGSISLSRHVSTEDASNYFDIEDGQSRLTVIQEYLDNKFMYLGKYFRDRTDYEKNKFLNYIFPTEIMTPARSSRNPTMTIQEHHYENFDRINKGKPLCDNDKYWCWKDKPQVKFSLELIDLFKERCTFMQTKSFGTVSKDGKVNRKVLENICTLVGSILYEDCYKKAYSRHYENIGRHISPEQKNLVFRFMNHYIKIHNKIYENFPKRIGEQTLQFNNPGKFLSLVIHDYKSVRNGVTNEDKIKMWADILNIHRVSPNFMKGTQSLYNSLTDGDKRNQELSNIIKRYERIIEFYNNKRLIKDRYHIEYVDYAIETNNVVEDYESEDDEDNEED